MWSSLMSGGKNAMEMKGSRRCSATLPAHVGLVDEHGVEVGAADGVGAVAEDHAGGVFDALDGEAEGCEAVEFAEALVQLLQGAERVVLLRR